ncbi:FimB/Mfa2 family fimbrial subunit [Porphyromonas pogonae]|uniref:FimB/Mfa2 family fimbrial subunit n=3 Tax=Porphyromonas pogonae TaxID=867595 RepID=UPI002E763D4D|nr:FimB/Mfa2 family fimbrial subunit [Porphyromonas pogonae]
MKYTNLVGALLIIFITSRCTSDVDRYNTHPGSNSSPKTQKVITLKIHKPGITLRGMQADPMTLVKEYTLYFYDQSGNFCYQKSFKATSGKNIYDIDLDLKNGKYKLLVVGNSSEHVKAHALSHIDSLSIDYPCSIYKTISFEDNNTKKSKVASMLNKDGLIDITIDSEKSNIPVEVSLEPNICRVIVTGNPLVENGTIETHPFWFAINSMAKGSRLIKGKQMISKEASQVIYPETSLYTGSLSADKSALMEKISCYSGDNDKVLWLVVKEAQDPLIYNEIGVYVKETTIDKSAYLKGLCPHVIIRVKYLPNSLNFVSQEKSWVCFNDQYYTLADFRSVMSNKSNQSIALQRAIEKLSESNKLFTKSFDVGGIQYYHQGINYYIVYIEHYRNDDTGNVILGTVRNHEYQIQIERITKRGLPEFPNFSMKEMALEPIQSKGVKTGISLSESKIIKQKVSL